MDRSRGFPAVVIAFLAGVLVAAVVIPGHRADGDSGATSLEAAAPAAVDTAAPATAPVTAAPTDGSAFTPATPVSPAPSTGAAPAPAPSSGAGPATSPVPAGPTSAGNGGATARGVTGTQVKVAAINLDTSDLAAACPRCGNGETTNGAPQEGLLAAWRKDGQLPVHGRDIVIVHHKVRATMAEDARNVCVQIAQQEKPFVVLAGAGTEAAAQCLSSEFHLPVVHTAGGALAQESFIRRVSPNWVEAGPTGERMLRGFVDWADKAGMLAGKTLGLYSPENDDLDGIVTRGLRTELARRGYKLAVDLRASGAAATGSANASDPVAVQRFRSSNVQVALLFTGSLGFQNAAQGQGYKPTYPVTDWAYAFTDAVSDITFNADAMDGAPGMMVKWWGPWATRKPATTTSNKAAQYCIDATEAKMGRPFDVWDDDAQLTASLDYCTNLMIARQAIQNAGPQLTLQSFLGGVYRIKNMQTPTYVSVTFAPGKLGGSDLAATATFKKARWQPDNDYWRITGPWAPMIP